MQTIEINSVSKIYGKQKALDNVTLTVNKGEVVGLLGPNGAGKSTLMKILTSFIPPTSGTVLIKGMDIQENSIETRKLIGYLPENNPLYPEMFVKEYLTYVLRIYRGINKQKTEKIIELTGLGPEQKKRIGALSKGYRQRVGLAQALIHDPEILILDEPTSGLDPNQLVDIRQIISELGKQKTIILSTHIMQEVEAVCGRIVIIDKGRIVADDKTANISARAGNQMQFRVEFKEKVGKTLLRQIPHVERIEKISDKEWLLGTNNNKDIRQEIFNFAVSKKLNILSLSKNEQKIEEVFQKLTN